MVLETRHLKSPGVGRAEHPLMVLKDKQQTLPAAEAGGILELHVFPLHGGINDDGPHRRIRFTIWVPDDRTD